MTSPKPIRLEISDDPEYEIPELELGNVYELAIPLPSINSTDNPIDIASDYAWALHAAQLLHPYVSSFSHRHHVPDNWHSEILKFSPTRIPECKAAIEEITRLFSDEEDELTDEARCKANEFESSLLDYPTVCFPDLADSFLANYVHSLEADYDEAELKNRFYREFPTWAYYFWKSFLSQKLGSDAYASTHSWILPRGADLKRLFAHLDWELSAGALQLQKAIPIKVGQLPYILASASGCVEIPFNCLNEAAQCWHHCLWNPSQAAERRYRSLGNAITNWRSHVHWEDVSSHREYLTEYKNLDWAVSGDGSIVTVSFDDVTLLTFLGPESKCRTEIIQKYLSQAEETCEFLYSHCGLPANSPCTWAALDDEMFEQLCYDILLRCERFNPARIRKLGKSRSRDGGRDIEVWTQMRPECPSQKWIYQCKFSTVSGSSLSGSQVAVSDVIDQYNADGFGIMTNRTIDATLYDKLDQIAENRSKRGAHLAVDTWSIHEIERFLYPRKDLLARYFKQAVAERDAQKTS